MGTELSTGFASKRTRVQDSSGKFVTRRGFLQRSLAFGLAVPGISMLFAACGGSVDSLATATSAGTSGGPTPTTASTPVSSGSTAATLEATGSPVAAATPAGTRPAAPSTPQQLTIGFQYDAASLDPAVINGPIESDVGYQIYSNLVRLPSGTTTNFVPDIAEKWSISDDGTTYTFDLRQGVQWHKGHGEFTAADVKYSFERLKNKESGSIYVSQASTIANIDASNDYQVVITLVAPWPNFFLEFLQYRPGFIVNKEAIETSGQNYSEKAIGTGPYELDSFTARNGITLKRNDAFYGPKPFFSTLRYEMVLKEEVLAIALANGEVDLMFGQDPTVELSLLENKNVTTKRFPSQRISYAVVNTQLAPTDDVRVRQALWWAIDKELLVKAGFEGLGVPVDTLLNPSIAESTWKDRPYHYDPDKAKQLLDEAGFDFKSSLLMPMENNDPITPVIQAQLADIGIKTETPAMERLALFDAFKTGKFNLGVTAILRYSGDQIYSQLLTKANIPGSNYAHYSNDQLEDLLLAARRELDDDKRMQLWAQLQQLVQQEVPYIPLFVPEWVLASKPDIQGAAPGPLRVYADEIWRTSGN
jgi:ABC-type transport system substrate-binding protein